jgi:hypothetical protein
VFKKILAVVLSLVVPVVGFAATEHGYKVRYDGGSITALKPGNDVELFIEENQLRIVGDKQHVAVVPASAITEVSYGQDVHRRVGAAIGLGMYTFGIGALMALSKSKKHYIGVTWNDAGKKGGFAFQADKGEYRGMLAGLEGVSGKKAVTSDAMTVKN